MPETNTNKTGIPYKTNGNKDEVIDVVYCCSDKNKNVDIKFSALPEQLFLDTLKIKSNWKAITI
jgi:hypothetical protein